MNTAILEKETRAKPIPFSGKLKRLGKPGRLRLRRILVPIDFSPVSGMALGAALPLAERFHAEIHLVYVAEPEYLLVPSPMTALARARNQSTIGVLTKARLREFASQRGVAPARVHLHALEGRPYSEICLLADVIDADLIVVGTHGWTGLKHLVIGSTAERIVRHAECPVLVFRALEKKTRPPGYRKILVPVDFPTPSPRSLRYAIAFARQFGAEITLLHSVDLRFLAPSEAYMLYDFAEAASAMEEAAQAEMKALLAATDWQGLKVKAVLENGHAGDRITRSAQELNADLVILPTHGYTGLKHIFLGSTAEYVVRHAPVPVLVTPPVKEPPPKPARKRK